MKTVINFPVGNKDQRVTQFAQHTAAQKHAIKNALMHAVLANPALLMTSSSQKNKNVLMHKQIEMALSRVVYPRINKHVA